MSSLWKYLISWETGMSEQERTNEITVRALSLALELVSKRSGCGVTPIEVDFDVANFGFRINRSFYELHTDESGERLSAGS